MLILGLKHIDPVFFLFFFSFSLTAGIFVEHRNNHSNHSVEFEMRATHKMFLLDAFASYLGY